MNTTNLRRLAAGFLLTATVVAVHPGTADAAPTWSGPCHAAVDRYFPPAARGRMHVIVHRESRGLPGVQNRIRTRAGRATGCAQILPGYAGQFMRAARCNSLFVADCNIATARKMWDRAGWRPWAVR